MTYQGAATRSTSATNVPIAANVTASIASSSPFLAVTLASLDPAGHQTGSSTGTTALAVLGGGSLSATVTLTLPDRNVPPGPFAATLTIQGDTWDAAIVRLTAYFTSVDETTPLGAKWEQLGGLAALGPVQGNAADGPDGLGFFQVFAKGAIFWALDFGATYLTRAIYDKWNSPSVAASKTADGLIIRGYLRYPTGDGFATVETGGQAAYFETGAIVVRASGQAFVVYGPIYAKYRTLGTIVQGAKRAPFIGLPTSDEQSVASGRLSQFDGATIYYSDGTGAQVVYGAIRDRYLALGGPGGGLVGFPTSDETSVLNGATEIGRMNTFAGGTRAGLSTGQVRIYWSAGTGAWEVYGGIGAQWLGAGGPIGPLGFPTSGESDTPKGGRFNQFEHGIMVWPNNTLFPDIYPVQGLRLALSSFADTAHGDFNVQINITDSTGQVNHGRMPSGGNYSNGNAQFTAPIVLMAVPTVTATYTLDVWMLCVHENTIGKDDEDGTVTAHFTIDNVWGMLDNPVYQNGSLTAGMKVEPVPQAVAAPDTASFITTLFWPFKNTGVDSLSWETFSDTYADVSADDDSLNLGTLAPWNWHLFERAFFQLIYTGMANGGVCFGMCLETNYARQLMTPFVEPIYTSPFNTYRKDNADLDMSKPGDATVQQQIEIKHGYQLGAGYLEWYLGKFTAGALHDPVRAFQESRDAYARGDWPILILSESDELSLDGHAVVPYAWNPSTGTGGAPLSAETWTIFAANPNNPGAAQGQLNSLITIDPFHQTFTFAFDASTTYSGTNQSGGRLLSIPFSQLNSQPVTPGDVIFALIAGGVCILAGGGGQTTQITDETGKTFYSYRDLARPAAPAATTKPGALAQALQPLRERIVNPDPKSRVPDLVFVPLTQAPDVRSAQDTRLAQDVHDTQSAASEINKQAARDIPATPNELYYLKRPVPNLDWGTPIGGRPSPTSAGAAAGGRPAAPATGARTGAAAASTMLASVVARRPSATEPQALESMDRQPALTFDVAGSANGAYEWGVYSPRMSATVTAPASGGASDVIVLSQPGTAAQSLGLQADKNAPARKFGLTVAGWRGDHAPTARSYALANLTVPPGASFTVSVGDGGKELWCHAPDAAATFDLTVYAGPGAAGALTRTGVSVASGMVCRLRPNDWTPSAIAGTSLAVEVLDTTGRVVHQGQL